MRGGWAGTSVRDPESQERTHESLKGPIDILFDFFIIIFLVFSTQIHNFERSFSLSSGPKAVLFRLAKFLLEALVQSVDKSLRFVMAQLVRHLATSLLESSNDKSMSAWYASYIEAT